MRIWKVLEGLVYTVSVTAFIIALLSAFAIVEGGATTEIIVTLAFCVVWLIAFAIVSNLAERRHES